MALPMSSQRAMRGPATCTRSSRLWIGGFITGFVAAGHAGSNDESLCWSRRQESNLYLPLRRRPFYPLNYGELVAARRCEARAAV